MTWRRWSTCIRALAESLRADPGTWAESAPPLVSRAGLDRLRTDSNDRVHAGSGNDNVTTLGGIDYIFAGSGSDVSALLHVAHAAVPYLIDAKPGQLAAWIRRHWHIENKIHWVRDVTYDEDRSQIRTGTGPQVMAALRNAAIGALRIAGVTNIASANRHHARDSTRPLALLGII